MSIANIRIANLSDTKVGVRCDRASKLGNPFYISEEAFRDKNVKAYRAYLHLVVNTQAQPCNAAQEVSEKFNLEISIFWLRPSRAELIDELTRVEGLIITQSEVTLLCWGPPGRNHCEVLKSYFNYSLDFCIDGKLTVGGSLEKT